MTAEELLAAMAEPPEEDDGYCIIDPETRVITIPPEYQLLGVESDEKAERIYFKCPKIVGDDIDLSKLAIRVNFRNAGQVVDQYLVDDVAVDGDNITFSWLLSRRVTQYEGDVNFIVCAVRVHDDATITNEWNTTLATAQVLEGLEAEMVLPEEETDIVNQLLSLAETRLNDVKEATADANTAASNANQKAQEAENAAEDARAVTEQITKDSYLHTALQSFIDTVTAIPTAYGNAIVKKIEGFIRQKTTTGAQLFDAFHVYVENGARNAKALNGGKDVQVTGKKSDSGTGYAYYTIPASLVDGKSIYVYGEYSGNASFSISIKKSDNTWLNPGVPTRTWTKIDIPQGALQARVILYPNGVTATDETAIFKNIKVGFAQFETWEPYTGGQPAPNPDYPMEVQGTGYRGFFDGDGYRTIYVDGSGSQSANTAWFLTDTIIPCKAGDRIKILYDKKELIDYYGIVYYTDGVWKSRPADNKTGEWVVPSGINGFRINCGSNDVGTFANNDLTGLCILVNDQYAVAVKSEGTNILPKTIEYEYQCKAIFVGDDLYIKSTGSDGVSYAQIIIGTYNKLAGKTIYVKQNGSLTYAHSVYCMNVRTTNTKIEPSSDMGYKIPENLTDVDNVSILVYVAINRSAFFPKLQVSFSKDIGYTPNQSNTVYIPVDYPLFEGDKIIQRNGEYKLLRKWGFKTYDGSDDENWRLFAGTDVTNNFAYMIVAVTDALSAPKPVSNIYSNRVIGVASSKNAYEFSGYIILHQFVIFTNKYESETAFKTWLKSNPITLAYQLETPTEEPLSPEAVKALHSIMATDEQTELTIVGVPADAEISNQFLLPRNEDGALNTTAYCTAEKNKIVLNELVAQNLDARVNKLEIDNASLTEQTIVVE